MELLALISVLIAAASVLICVFVIRRVKTRLNGMLDALADIKAGNGSRRILSTMDELTAPIAYEINDIVSSYEKKLAAFRRTQGTNRQLMTSLSHDVRTPLTTLIGYLDATHKGLVSGREKDDSIETARRKAYDLKEYIDALFDWFKLNSDVKKGRVYGLLGRNGAGKTTTMKMLLGLTEPTSGEIKIWGKTLRGNEKEVLPRIGSLIESPGFYPNLTATENLRIFAALRGVPSRHAVKDALDLVGLPYRDKKLFSQYSLGMKQRLAIALAVMHDPELFILDEPTNGLDPIGIAEIRSFIRRLCDEGGKTVLLSSHILSEISLMADDIGIIDHGVLLEEESLSALESKNGRFIHLGISDAAQAARLLETVLHTGQFRIDDDKSIRIFDTSLSLSLLSETMVKGGVALYDLHLCENTLEDYFRRVTGGEGIA